MFLFVDQILELVPGERAVGFCHLSSGRAFLAPGNPCSRDPAELSVPPSLLGEAVGQLAAWTVLVANDFRLRPVGALIERVDIIGRACADDPLLLAVRIDSRNDESVVYSGTASVDGVDVLKFENAYSPLLPVQDFDDPGDLSRRFHLIPKGGDAAAIPPAYDAARSTDYECDRVLGHDPGQGIVAERRFDESEPFFSDHFPRKPVVPMTVLMECLLRLARRLFDESGDEDAPLTRVSVRNAKISRFIRPGDSVTASVRLLERGGHGARFRARCDLDGHRVCQAKVEFSTVPS